MAVFPGARFPSQAFHGRSSSQMVLVPSSDTRSEEMVCEVSELRSSRLLVVWRGLMECCVIGHCKWLYVCYATGASIAASLHFVIWLKSGLCFVEKKVAPHLMVQSIVGLNIYSALQFRAHALFTCLGAVLHALGGML